MAISVSVPKEITEYREKIIFGLSLRQFLCSVVALVLAISLGALCTWVLRLSMDLTGYIIMAVSVPIMGHGFVRINNMPLEQYLALWWRHKFGTHRLTYQTTLLIDVMADQNTNERSNPHGKAQKGSQNRGEWSRRPGAGRKAQRKRARRKIAAARQALRLAQKAQKAALTHGRT